MCLKCGCERELAKNERTPEGGRALRDDLCHRVGIENLRQRFLGLRAAS